MEQSILLAMFGYGHNYGLIWNRPVWYNYVENYNIGHGLSRTTIMGMTIINIGRPVAVVGSKPWRL